MCMYVYSIISELCTAPLLIDLDFSVLSVFENAVVIICRRRHDTKKVTSRSELTKRKQPDNAWPIHSSVGSILIYRPAAVVSVTKNVVPACTRSTYIHDDEAMGVEKERGNQNKNPWYMRQWALTKSVGIKIRILDYYTQQHSYYYNVITVLLAWLIDWLIDWLVDWLVE